MLYHWLYPLHEVFSWLNVFRYQTFRAMLAFFFTFLLVLLIQPLFIKKVRKKGIKGQPIRSDGPKDHEVKQGTPTMGGLVIILSLLFSVLLLADLSNYYIWLILGITVGHAMLGFLDDYRKISAQNTKGISGKTKLLFQIVLSFLFGVILLQMDFATTLHFPFFKDFVVDLGIWFVPFVVLVIVATSNAVNLTDGLDGLAIGSVMTVAVTYGLFSYIAGHAEIAEYLQIHPVTGAGEVSIIMAAVVAGGLGFLWYNTFPAQVFMGDTGSLALGALLGAVAVLVKHEILLIIAGGIFVLEAASVIIQVYSFKMTGKRVFRMAPIHHHFELKGWAEPKIIVRFWIISIVLALVCIATLKLR